jgi:crotonobetainyl-CoA:carnitine CoA-transferase CaiB-like acyl-CoA transferase
MPSDTLAGVRVLDLTGYLAGPYGAALLGDLGADVIKVEPPGGDTMRQYPSTLAGESRSYLGANRNKRAIVLDLKAREGLAVFRTLVSKADVVLHNFRGGVAERLGIGYDALVASNPRLVYCSLTGYGTTGPLGSHPGFDQALQSFSGVSAAQGADRGVPEMLWGSIIDYFSATIIAMAISAALYNREHTGRPQKIEASLLRSALALQAGRMVWADSEPREVQRDLRPGRLAGIHPTREGWLYLQAQTPKFWEALCEFLGLQALARDPRYATMRLRKENEDTLIPQLHAALARRSALEWEAMFGDKVPCAAVRTIEDMFDHPQVLAQGLVATHDHPLVGRYRAGRGPVAISAGGEERPERRAPMLAEHTDEVLAEHGFDAAAIAALRAGGAVA